MSLKIDAPCPDASLEIFQPICYRGTHRLQRDLCRCFHEGFLKTVQLLVVLSAIHILKNNPHFIVKGVEVWPRRGPNLVADKGRNVHCIQS